MLVVGQHSANFRMASLAAPDGITVSGKIVSKPSP